MSTGLPPSSGNMSGAAAYARKHLLPYWRNLLLIVMKNVIGSLLYMIPPLLTKYVLERVLPEHNWNLLLIVTAAMVAAPIVGSLLVVMEVVWGRFILRLASRGRADLFHGIIQQPMDRIRGYRTGDLLTRLLDDTRSIGDIVDGHLGFMLFHIVTIVSGSAILFGIAPGLAALVLTLWAGLAILVTVLSRQVKRKAAETARHQSLVSDKLREIVSGAAFLKASGLEQRALADVQKGLDREWEHTRRTVLADHRIRMLHASLNACILVLMYAAGGQLALHGQITVGALIAFIAVYNWLRPFGISMIEMVMAVVKIWPSVGRVKEIAFTAEEAPPGLVPQGPVELEVKRLAFRYDGKPTLEDINFRAAPGSIVSIVGPRGSGKSTLADLLLRLQTPESGEIRLNGLSLASLDSDWLRRHILVVTQDIMLRSGTIADNIVYGSGETGAAALQEAIRTAELEEWLSRLPEGLRTPVGEQALQLSGGERQRISIARALLRKPAILILDEATSALDPGTERRLLERMIRTMQGTTLIFITHRLDIAQRSDEVIVLCDGRIVQAGRHADLLSQPGMYRELWREQAASAG
ncbi:MAG: Efflux transporter, permease/ATP-binding protein [Paenibacillus sp.]|nr:Efflux transporter, permease/ATP-binding protein [Paenibacillus sp.]